MVVSAPHFFIDWIGLDWIGLDWIASINQSINQSLGDDLWFGWYCVER
jgi:hypothetical protein